MTEVFCDVFSDALLESTMPVDGSDKLTKVAIGAYRSRNGREYSEQALNDLVRLSENCQCYLDHPKESEARDRQGVRSVRDLIGVFHNSRRQDGKPFSDLQLVGEHKGFVQELATKMPRSVGFSINCPRSAVKSTKQRNGVETIEGIGQLNSIDLVASPALTKGMFESHFGKGGDRKMMTEEQINEAFMRVLPGGDFWWEQECQKTRRVQEGARGLTEEQINEQFMAVLP